ncbi:hypothetical protein NliqN6_6598 [Naganishia liquefaciens]|uniref:HAD family phosphatase n=1 Tax=Naganishia liquefaciens TaxID=104408 RepID=A0A8H3TYW5_9TREE|nr:hypothetical protein NliqN6_6598 [Naganishia liquefaciens]
MSGNQEFSGSEYCIFDMDGLLIQHEANQYIHGHYPDLADKLSMDNFVAERNRKQDETFAKVQPMKGAVELVKHLHGHNTPITLATSSRDAVFRFKSSNLAHFFDAFPANSIITADSKEEPNGRGKPCPDIYLAAARSLGRKVGYGEQSDIEAERIERSKGLGLEAGVRAGMDVIWVPDAEVRAANPRETYGAKVILASLSDFKPEL